MKKNKKNNSPVPHDDQKAKSQRNLKKLGILFLNFTLFYALFRILIELSERTRMMWIYYASTVVYALGACGLFVAYFVLNSFSFDKRPRTWDELPEKWSDEEKRDFLAKQPERQEKARNLLYILMPIVVTVFISYIELNFLK